MFARKYYSASKGQAEDTSMDLELLRRLFVAIYETFKTKQYFDEVFGTHCTDTATLPAQPATT